MKVESTWKEHQEEYTNELNSNLRCDVAIIGGGIVGISAAYHLSKQGLAVVLCEAGNLAEGSTGFGGGLLSTSTTLDLIDLVDRYGIPKGKKIYDSMASSITDIERVVEKEKISCDFQRCSSLYFAEKESQLPTLQREYEIKMRLGYPVELLTHTDASIPLVGAMGALRTHNEASMNAVAFVLGVARACVRDGVRIYTKTKIASLEETPDFVTLTTERGNIVQATYVVHAAHIWSNSKTLDNHLELYAAPLMSYIVITKPVPGLSKRWNDAIMWNADEAYRYLRLLPDERVLIGGEDYFFGKQSEHGAQALGSGRAQCLMHKLKSYFPDIQFETEAAWSGFLPYPLDGLPIVELRGRIVSAITDGLPLSWLVGRVMSEKITTSQSEYDEFFDSSRNFGFLRNAYIKIALPRSIKRLLLRIVTRYESGT